jgi:hypothetical protein
MQKKWKYARGVLDAICHGGGNVMVWRCFGGGKVGAMYRENGILKKEGYHSIMQLHAIACGQWLIGTNFLLQQDNDPNHSSKLYNNYLGKKQSAGILSIMEWLAQWPDLNPIDLLCLTVGYVRSAIKPIQLVGGASGSMGWNLFRFTSTNWQIECQRSAWL